MDVAVFYQLSLAEYMGDQRKVSCRLPNKKKRQQVTPRRTPRQTRACCCGVCPRRTRTFQQLQDRKPKAKIVPICGIGRRHCLMYDAGSHAQPPRLTGPSQMTGLRCAPPARFQRASWPAIHIQQWCRNSRVRWTRARQESTVLCVPIYVRNRMTVGHRESLPHHHHQ